MARNDQRRTRCLRDKYTQSGVARPSDAGGPAHGSSTSGQKSRSAALTRRGRITKRDPGFIWPAFVSGWRQRHSGMPGPQIQHRRTFPDGWLRAVFARTAEKRERPHCADRPRDMHVHGQGQECPVGGRDWRHHRQQLAVRRSVDGRGGGIMRRLRYHQWGLTKVWGSMLRQLANLSNASHGGTCR